MNNPATADLLKAMLNKPLYVGIRRPHDLTRVSELLEQHLRWVIAAEKRGEIFASGPFVAEGAAPGALGGLSVLRAASAEEAREILAGDPFIREGVFTVEVKKWLVMEGGLTLTVRFSDQSSRLL